MSIGGTSGSGANTLSLNLNGVGVSYDLGPSISTVQRQAYNFVGSSFGNAAAFEGGAISGANNLVADLTAPLIAGSLAQMQTNNQQLPSLFNTIEANNFTLGQQSIAMQGDLAKASIASSQASAQAASNAGGGCYITSAVCETLGLPDDCHTLRTLRAFRDNYLKPTNVGRAFVAEYYATAPALVAKIKARTDVKDYTAALYARFILPALLAIEGSQPARAFKIYREMIYAVRAEN